MLPPEGSIGEEIIGEERETDLCDQKRDRGRCVKTMGFAPKRGVPCILVKGVFAVRLDLEICRRDTGGDCHTAGDEEPGPDAIRTPRFAHERAVRCL